MQVDLLEVYFFVRSLMKNDSKIGIFYYLLEILFFFIFLFIDLWDDDMKVQQTF